MITLPNECLFEILNNLKGYRKSLFSCLLTNRQWCRTAVPILWNDLDISTNSKLVRTCLLVLNAEERAQLIQFNIIFTNDSKPLFEYVSYATTIKINSDYGIKNWLSNESNCLSHCSLVNVIQAIKCSLIVMILRTNEKLKSLSIYGKQGNLSTRILDKFKNMISLDFKELKTLIVALHNNSTLTELNLSV
ncbi:f-box domain-containing protein [Gigaspora margarita]|uniref:F-box domain-containing protein n=1 Tax=Gigaspora margarita TaxID=4874 RepID=A0A8H4EUQ3_GIGMA|nr:f-box domain-containing protein [Gigaspora margarita]